MNQWWQSGVEVQRNLSPGSGRVHNHIISYITVVLYKTEWYPIAALGSHVECVVKHGISITTSLSVCTGPDIAFVATMPPTKQVN